MGNFCFGVTQPMVMSHRSRLCDYSHVAKFCTSSIESNKLSAEPVRFFV